MSRVIGLVLLLCLSAAPARAKGLDIYFIDVEGGQSTLIVTPEGQSLLIDAGYGRGSRDPDRILAAARDAGLDRIDYMMVTHFHGDHVGGIPELASRIPIITYVDYGGPMGTIYGTDRMTVRSFATYEQARNLGGHYVPRPGGHLPLTGVEATFVSSGGELITSPLPGGGQMNDGCENLENHPADSTENFRSLGIALKFGAFTFVDVGDLSGTTLQKLFCPVNMVGEASVYLISHHGDYDSDGQAMYRALKPRVAVMNNSPTKGGDPQTFRTVQAQQGIDLWQLHASQHPEAQNAPEDFIANLDDQEGDGNWIKLNASTDGSFTVTNGRTGFARSYTAPVKGPSPAMNTSSR